MQSEGKNMDMARKVYENTQDISIINNLFIDRLIKK